LSNIANHFGSTETASTHNLSRYFTPVLGAILPITQRSTNESNFRTAAFQTIALFITASADDTLPAVDGMVQEMLARQQQLFAVHNQLVSMEDRDNWNDMQVHICVVLQAALNRAPAVVQARADDIMMNLLQLMQASKTAGVVEDAFATVGAIANATEQQFTKYMEAFAPFLIGALSATEDWQMAQAGAFVVSDIARALGSAFEPYAAGIVDRLLEILRNGSILRTVKPHTITAIGDIATAIGPAFKHYLDNTMGLLSQGATGVSGQADVVDQEFFASMREALVDAFAGILAGLRGVNGDPAPFQQYVSGIMQFIQTFYADPAHTKDFLSSSLGLIGDMGETFGGAVRDSMAQDFVQEMVREGRDKRMSKSVRNNAAYAQQVSMH
jgi:importin subunit beta-1